MKEAMLYFFFIALAQAELELQEWKFVQGEWWETTHTVILLTINMPNELCSSRFFQLISLLPGSRPLLE